IVITLAALGTASAYSIPKLPAVNAGSTFNWQMFRPIITTIKMARGQSILWHGVLGVSWFWYLGASFLALMPSLAKDHVKGSEQIATLFLALFSVGIAVGSMLFSRFSRGRLE